MEEGLREYLEGKFNSLDERLDALGGTVAAVEDRLGVVEERLDAMDGRLVAVEEGLLKAVNQGLAAVGDRLAEVVEDVHSMQNRVDGLEQAVRRLGVRLDRVDSDVRSVADGHMLLFEGMTRRHEEVRDGMAEVRSLFMAPILPRPPSPKPAAGSTPRHTPWGVRA